MSGEPLLSVQHLVTRFDTDRGPVLAVDDVSFDIPAQRTVALVGESGSGKSVTALSILRLIAPPGHIQSGKILFEGKDLLTLPEPELRAVRGAKIALIFQEPMSALNPVYPVGAQVSEVIRLHERVSRKSARDRTVELFEHVGIPAPAARFHAYPHELSGGLRQRVLIAMALACRPALLIADEPTTALDVSVQAQVLELFARIQEEMKMSVLLITHDLGVVAEVAHEVIVFYAGRVAESGPVSTLLRAPEHPYTRALLASVPPLGTSGRVPRPPRLATIEGVVPDLARLPGGCRFRDRCPLYESRPPGHERCDEAEPPSLALAADHRAFCYFAGARP